MYIIGIHHAQKNTRTDHMLAILNFVFAVTSIVVTCWIDWDDDINSWRFIITADKDQLTYNIERMKELVPAFEV
jgi:hypothetical protein